ncbi:telomere binding protein [Tulasnella sp. 418]|nr:telomere binding protein [Tulasnella sp. 418]
MTPENDNNLELRENLNALRGEIGELSTLTTLLASTLAFFKLLPPDYQKYNTRPISGDLSSAILRLIPSFQAAVVEHVLPTWDPALEEARLAVLTESFFCPKTSGGIEALVIAHAYNSLLLPPIGDPNTKILLKLVARYPASLQFTTLFTRESVPPISQKEGLWDIFLQGYFSVPSKVMNILGRETPEALSNNAYLSGVAEDAEKLIYDLSSRAAHDQHLESLSTFIVKMLRNGLFPHTNVVSFQPSFFSLNTTRIRERVCSSDSCSTLWTTLLSTLPSPLFQQLLNSLLACMSWASGLDLDKKTRIRIIDNAKFLRRLIGPLGNQDQDRWDNVQSILLGRSWGEELARTVVHWVAGFEPRVDAEGLSELQSRALDVWASSQHILYSLLAKQKYVTTLLALSISFQDPGSPSIRRLLTDQLFLNSISKYLSHQDPSVRRCGMFIAEIVASKCNQKLDFASWEGDGESKEWFRSLRQLVIEGTQGRILDDSYDEKEAFTLTAAKQEEIDIADISTSHPDTEGNKKRGQPAVMYDSDDSLTGYASPDPSSRSASPTPSELEEIAKDPSLVAGREANKIPKPVFLLQLSDLITTQKDEEQKEPAKHEMALREGESLIRRKANYGTELDENAVNLTLAFIRLQDNYEITGFSEKKQSILAALVACCPERAVPCMIEQFFSSQYSTEIRSTILTALVLGAKELAGVTTHPVQPTFPSKTLPPHLHRKYLSSSDTENPVQSLLEGITRQAIDQSREKAENEIPQIAREKQLRLRRNLPARSIVEIRRTQHPNDAQSATVTTTFNDIAPEFFIMPLINRFWLYLHDERSRESRSAFSSSRYKGAGTGMILHPMTLGQFLSSLAVLSYMAQNSLAYISIITPAALELAIAVGTRPLSDAEVEEADLDQRTAGEKQATVITGALELSLVVLDGCWNVDQGRNLALDHPELLLAVKELGTGIFRTLEKGVLLPGSGNEAYARAQRASAGVLLKVEEMIAKWRASMLTY